MKIGVPKETLEGERRVALVPETVGKLMKEELEVLVESGAGRDYHLDGAYEEAGARIVESAEELYGEADVVAKVREPSEDEVEFMHEGTYLVCFLQPHTNAELVQRLAEQGVTVFSMDAIPRTAQAQRMDALSAMSSIGGYKSALIAANDLGKYLPMMTTAAGTTKAAKVLVVGTGVAGLQAIATSRRLGAEVSAFDIRPETKEQVESLGATFLESSPEEAEAEPEEEVEEEPLGPFDRFRAALGFSVEREPKDDARDGAGPEGDVEDGDEEEEEDTEEDTGGYAKEQAEEKQQRDRELLHEHVAASDVVITTALVPGKKAPVIVTEPMISDMKPGSIVVDLAAEAGGNCELTRPGEVVERDQVRIHGLQDVPSSVPIHASQLFSRNVQSLLGHLVTDGELQIDFEDQITDAACIAHDGEVRHEGAREALGQPVERAEEAAEPSGADAERSEEAAEPSGADAEPSGAEAEPSGAEAEPSGAEAERSGAGAEGGGER